MERRHKELAGFLRSRRERLKPADVGLRSGTRRRTPGLRREEVADLAGIGTGWYASLEQGRDVRPSEGAIRRIARALQLDPADQEYLLQLALEPLAWKRGEEPVQPELSRVIGSLTTPACVLDRAWNIVNYNEAANALYDLAYLPNRNLMRLMFTAETRLFVMNWEDRARQYVFAFRAQNAASLRNPMVVEVVDDLAQRSPQFRAWWAEQTVRPENGGVILYEHPFVGRLQLNFVQLRGLDSPALVTKLYSCADEETQHRLDELRRQLREGERSPDHNLWVALAARVRTQARNGHAA
jgi:transcriptional regulator with XRE-family HTH domain